MNTPKPIKFYEQSVAEDVVNYMVDSVLSYAKL
jgi:hypothetical protein